MWNVRARMTAPNDNEMNVNDGEIYIATISATRRQNAQYTARSSVQ